MDETTPGTAQPASGSDASSAPALVDERARLISRNGRDDPRAAEIAARLAALLDRGRVVRALELASPGPDRAMARRLVDREPVNPAADDAGAERRLEADRRVYVVEHPGLPDRPLNVLWVALCRGVPSTLEQVLAPDSGRIDASTADTAVLYSIWNAEEGLAGLGSGDLLAEGAARALLDELDHLETVTTMSPIPGLRDWAAGRGIAEPDAVTCARYLVATGDDERLLDPVARFHMGNGARLWRLLPGADPSPRGLQRSFGWMVNYRYHPEDKAANRAELQRGLPVLGDRVATLLEAS